MAQPNNPRIIPSPVEPGVYYVDRDTWQVGTRYEVLKVLGAGSFSAVCLAWDRVEEEKVALKRVGDVFASPDYAKRVLREVCIMRRLEHPNIIRLRDVFLKPSPRGKYVFRGGRLVPTSFDCYLALEYCDQGDLFNMRGQLPEHEVRSLMWQLLGALRYLHGLNVWHRDIKTGNLLLTLAEGRRVLKVADFGSARSAKDTGDAAGGGQLPDQLNGAPLSRELTLPPQSGAGEEGAGEEGDTASDMDCEAATDSTGTADGGASRGRGRSAEPPAAATAPRSRARSSSRQGRGGGCGAAGCPGGGLVAIPAPEGGYQPPLTSLVCTPCYRAPEVVMSRGGYSSSIDMWSAGCVFGELLQRAAYVGKAATPHLQVAPVFAISGKPLTPHAGQRYGPAEGPGCGGAYAELSALFAVIGTPAWACIEGVPSEAWRRYLFHIPGRAPTLHRRFGQAGEVAVDLLARLLQFDPGRRASAEEAMAHEYFAMMHMEAQMAAAELAPQADGLGRPPRSFPVGAAPAGKAARGVGGFYRRSTSPTEPADAAAHAPAAAATTALDTATRLPSWPPGRTLPQRGSAFSEAAGVPEGPEEMDVEAGSDAGADKEIAQVPMAPPTATGTGSRPGTSGAGSVGGGSFSLLTKRKQLDEECEEAEEPARQQQQARVQGQQHLMGDGGAQLRFWQIDEPALALAALEAELALLVPPSDSAVPPATATAANGGSGAPRGASAVPSAEAVASIEECKDRLRTMLERECEEHAARAAMRRGAAKEARGTLSSAGGSIAAGSGSGGAGTFRRNSAGLPDGLGPAEGQMHGTSAAALHGHLRPDPGQQLDPSLIGYERIPYHADAAAAGLEPEKHLSAGRHGEWTQSSLALQRREQGAGTWGVTLVPPGMDEASAAGRAYMKVVRSQHAR
ncbi:hypothetical protein Agub_g5009 [Astrephomene gubernaculifera]|uniref:Protein kinase domain-containing protein n=1 Tax=Astrephomene gubernaculifera TaxID=47775 RepID=A0AAD3HKN3_9CHLO|nr:hypothetical protein Agub_g5009 [Astrephomene gubernaculifera]